MSDDADTPREDAAQFDPADFLPYLLNRSAEAASLRFQKVYRQRYGMKRTGWRVLFHLGRYGEMTAGEIGRLSGEHKTRISRAVSELAEKRFLSRRVQDADRRRETLSLTATGRAAFQDLAREARRCDAELLAEFSPDEAARLKADLRRLARAVLPE